MGGYRELHNECFKGDVGDQVLVYPPRGSEVVGQSPGAPALYVLLPSCNSVDLSSREDSGIAGRNLSKLKINSCTDLIAYDKDRD